MHVWLQSSLFVRGFEDTIFMYLALFCIISVNSEYLEESKCIEKEVRVGIWT